MAEPTLSVQEFDVSMLFPNVGSLEIYGEWGLAEYFRFLEDMKMRESGFTYAEIGYAERKAAMRPHLIYGETELMTPSENWSIRDHASTPEGSIAVLKLEGVMRSQSGLCNEGVDSLVRNMREVYQNKNLIGAIVETDSGGGESGAGTRLKSVFGERNKPVVIFAHMAASAAYRAASGADEIIASSGAAEFGSIGTMVSMSLPMLEMYGKYYRDFYGKTADKKNADFREAIQGKFDGIQKLVDEKTAAFQAEIAQDRPLSGSPEKIAETLNGAMYSAQEAKRRGLVDMVGNMNTAVKRVKALKKAKY